MVVSDPQAHRLVLRNAWDTTNGTLSPLAVRLLHEVAYGGGGNRKGAHMDVLEVPVVGYVGRTRVPAVFVLGCRILLKEGALNIENQPQTVPLRNDLHPLAGSALDFWPGRPFSTRF